MPAIGIDLGTTNSCVAVLQRGKVEVIANDSGSRTTPSCVAFTDEERQVGEAAMLQMSRNPENTVYDVKRLIGQPFSDPSVREDMKRWPFRVVDEEGKPKIVVQYQNEEKTFLPEEISAMVLSEMKKIAEAYIGEEVTGAVITVPAYFNNSQRSATKDAAKIAKLHVLGMLNEPTAAAIAYGVDKKAEFLKNVLIFDLGGGTFDVTVIAIKEKNYHVEATGGDTHLGGQDFNERLLNYFKSEFATKHGVQLQDDARAKCRLSEECEKSKKLLSTANKTGARVDSLQDGRDFETSITRARFEKLNEDLFDGTLQTVENVLRDARLNKEKIDEVVLVGGSTRIPIVQEMLETYFGKGKVSRTINPDEAVAYGAAVQAAFLSGDTTALTDQFKGIELQDVTPLSLGVETKGGVMTTFVKRNTTIPATATKILVTVVDDQTSMRYHVFEGERGMTEQNHLLGTFDLDGIPPAPAGEGQAECRFDIDTSGVLHVSAHEVTTKNRAEIKLTWNRGRLTEEEIQQLVAQAEEYQQSDEETMRRVRSANELEALAFRGLRIAKERGNSDGANKFRKMCGDVISWLDHNKTATLETIQARRNEIERALNEFM